MNAASSDAARIMGGTCKNRRLCIGRHCNRRKSEIRDSFARCVTIAPPTIAGLQAQGVAGAVGVAAILLSMARAWDAGMGRPRRQNKSPGARPGPLFVDALPSDDPDNKPTRRL